METLYYQSFGYGGEEAYNTRANHASAKPVVILLHGLFGMSDNLSGLARSLADDFNVIVPDLINHGRSPRRGLMGYPAMAADVFRLMDQLGIARAIVVGHSMGGKVAMQMATLAPERVQALVVVDIAPVLYKPRHEEILAALHKVAEARVGSRREAEEILSAYVPEKPLQQFLLKNMHKTAAGNWDWRFGLVEISKAYASLIAAPDMETPYKGRVLFIKGELSDYIEAGQQEVILNWFPQAELKIVREARHWVHAEKPQIFNALVRRFLGQGSDVQAASHVEDGL